MVKHAVLVLLVFILSSCARPETAALERIGLRAATVRERSDDHGGLLGDGLTRIHLKLSRAEAERLLGKPGWTRAPVPPRLLVRLFGGEDPQTQVRFGGYLVGSAQSADEASFTEPAVFQDGLFYFCDKKAAKTDRYDAAAFIRKNHPSLNVVFCYIEFESMECWYYELDT